MNSKKSHELAELRVESEQKIHECTGSMIHSTEQLHGQMELFRVTLLKKAEELQTLKAIHEQCPGQFLAVSIRK